MIEEMESYVHTDPVLCRANDAELKRTQDKVSSHSVGIFERRGHLGVLSFAIVGRIFLRCPLPGLRYHQGHRADVFDGGADEALYEQLGSLEAHFLAFHGPGLQISPHRLSAL